MGHASHASRWRWEPRWPRRSTGGWGKSGAPLPPKGEPPHDQQPREPGPAPSKHHNHWLHWLHQALPTHWEAGLSTLAAFQGSSSTYPNHTAANPSPKLLHQGSQQYHNQGSQWCPSQVQPPHVRWRAGLSKVPQPGSKKHPRKSPAPKPAPAHSLSALAPAPASAPTAAAPASAPAPATAPASAPAPAPTPNPAPPLLGQKKVEGRAEHLRCPPPASLLIQPKVPAQQTNLVARQKAQMKIQFGAQDIREKKKQLRVARQKEDEKSGVRIRGMLGPIMRIQEERNPDRAIEVRSQVKTIQGRENGNRTKDAKRQEDESGQTQGAEYTDRTKDAEIQEKDPNSKKIQEEESVCRTKYVKMEMKMRNDGNHDENTTRLDPHIQGGDSHSTKAPTLMTKPSRIPTGPVATRRDPISRVRRRTKESKDPKGGMMSWLIRQNPDARIRIEGASSQETK